MARVTASPGAKRDCASAQARRAGSMEGPGNPTPSARIPGSGFERSAGEPIATPRDARRPKGEGQAGPSHRLAGSEAGLRISACPKRRVHGGTRPSHPLRQNGAERVRGTASRLAVIRRARGWPLPRLWTHFPKAQSPDRSR